MQSFANTNQNDYSQSKSIQSNAQRLLALKRRHARLDRQIQEAQKRPYSQNNEINMLKQQKLKLKDEIETLQSV